jgi:glycolate oxidase FAD binding subunit
MSNTRLDRIAATIGADAVRANGDGRLVATPTSTEAMAGILGLAHDEAWQVAIEGGGSWRTDAPPADLTISTRGLDDALTIEPGAEDTATVQAGVSLDMVRHSLVDRQGWIALDPPGRTDRTVGSVLATATAGPLRAGFGPVRDQVLALTIATGNGRVLQLGREPGAGEVTAAMRLHLGGFGGFGVITQATLRVRPLPDADVTWVALGTRDRLSAAARELGDHRIAAAAAELVSPALASESEWLLAVRLMGSRDEVQAEGQRLASVARLPWDELPPERRALLWNGSSRGLSSVPVTFRLGVLPEGIDDAIDTVVSLLGEGMLSAGALAGSIRWSGHAEAERVRAVRGHFAAREVPLTLERAPWAVRRTIGHFGAYREGVGGPISQLRARHDPRSILVTGISGEAAR